MRIALIAPQPFVDIRATPMETLRLTRILADAGHRVDVITYPFGSAPAYPGVSVHRCRPLPFVRSVGIGLSAAKLLLDINLVSCTLRLARNNKFDCIHGVEEGALIGSIVSRRLGVPLVYDMDSVLSYEIGQSAARLLPGIVLASRTLERWAIRSAAVVMTISEHMAGFVKAIEPLARVVVVPDVPLSADVEPDPARVRTLLPSIRKNDGRLVLYAGSFARYQGLELLIDAMARLAADVPGAILLLVGGEQSEIKHLSTRADAAGVRGNVYFVGKRPPEEIPHFLAAADVLVSPRSRGMNPPAKVASYMKSGKPIVATNIPAHAAVLDHASAFLIEPTPDGLAAGMLDALSRPEEARRRGERARAGAKSLTPELHTRQVLEVYKLVEEIALGRRADA